LNHDGSRHGIFTDRVGVLSNDYFKHITSMEYEWRKADEKGMTFTIHARDTGETKFTATRCDLIFGSNQQLRSVSEVYASSDGERRFAKDFARVWDKVMMLDRYDVKPK
jgi:catalase-peroxidase